MRAKKSPSFEGLFKTHFEACDYGRLIEQVAVAVLQLVCAGPGAAGGKVVGVTPVVLLAGCAHAEADQAGIVMSDTEADSHEFA